MQIIMQQPLLQLSNNIQNITLTENKNDKERESERGRERETGIQKDRRVDRQADRQTYILASELVGPCGELKQKQKQC